MFENIFNIVKPNKDSNSRHNIMFIDRASVNLIAKKYKDYTPAQVDRQIEMIEAQNRLDLAKSSKLVFINEDTSIVKENSDLELDFLRYLSKNKFDKASFNKIKNQYIASSYKINKKLV